MSITPYPLSALIADLRLAVTTTSRRYCFIVGSGASRSSGIPTGIELVDLWLEHMHKQERPAEDHDPARIQSWATADNLKIPNFSYEFRGSFYGQVYKRAFMHDPALGQQFLSKLMDGKTPSFGYSVLARILSYTPHSVVITTNFDHLIEESLRRYSFADPKIITDASHAAAIGTSLERHRLHVLKLHGDIYYKTYNAHDEILRLPAEWKKAITRILSDFVPIVIGYGGNDPGFMSVLSHLNRESIPSSPLWFYRRTQPKHEAILQFLKKQSGHFVQGPDFDQVLLLIGSVFDIATYERRADTQRAHQQAAWMREFEYLTEEVLGIAKSAIPQGEPRHSVEYRELFRSAVPSFLRPDATGSWWEWHCMARIAKSLKGATDTYLAGMEALPDSLPLRAAYAGHIARSLNHSNDALKLITETLGKSEQLYGPNHPDTITILHQYARIHEYLNTYESRRAARDAFIRVLKQRGDVLGADHPDTLASLYALGTFMASCGGYEDALKYFSELHDRRRRLHGLDHKLTRQTALALVSIKQRMEPAVMIHQPHFLPWLGYFNKLANATHYVALDTVNYREGYYQNRTRIVDMHGKASWLTIPVSCSIHDPLTQCALADKSWQERVRSTLRHCYARSPFFDEVFESLMSALPKQSNSIVDVNMALIDWACSFLGLPDIRIHRASEFSMEPDRTQRLIEICQSLGIFRLLIGEGGSIKAHNIELLRKSGIELVQQQFRQNHPKYRHWQPDFYEGMSIIDALFQVGSYATRELVIHAWTRWKDIDDI